MEMFEARFGKVYSYTATMLALEASRTENEQTASLNSSQLYIFSEFFLIFDF
jgi:hypothetical protein